MNVLGDLVSRDHATGDDRLALRAPGAPPRSYSYREFGTTARKTGNFLRHLGVREGAIVGVTDDATPESLLSLFGVALLGGTVWFGPPAELDARALVAPVDRLDDYSLPPGQQYVVYGDPADDPSVAYFEREVWSENPGFPDVPVDPESAVLTTADGTLSHQEVLAAAERVVDEMDLGDGDEMAVRASLARPETVVAGVVAPLLVGASVLLPDDEAVGSVAVADGDAPEEKVVAVDAVDLSS